MTVTQHEIIPAAPPLTDAARIDAEIERLVDSNPRMDYDEARATAEQRYGVKQAASLAVEATATSGPDPAEAVVSPATQDEKPVRSDADRAREREQRHQRELRKAREYWQRVETQPERDAAAWAEHDQREAEIERAALAVQPQPELSADEKEYLELPQTVRTLINKVNDSRRPQPEGWNPYRDSESESRQRVAALHSLMYKKGIEYDPKYAKYVV